MNAQLSINVVNGQIAEINGPPDPLFCLEILSWAQLQMIHHLAKQRQQGEQGQPPSKPLYLGDGSVAPWHMRMNGRPHNADKSGDNR
jgi:hypothetical protein